MNECVGVNEGEKKRALRDRKGDGELIVLHGKYKDKGYFKSNG